MSATITIELCAEDRARLDHINVNLTELILRVMGSQKIDMGEVLRPGRAGTRREAGGAAPGHGAVRGAAEGGADPV